MFANLGLDSILVRKVSTDPKRAPELLGNALLLKTILAVLSLPIAALLIKSLGYPLTVQQGVFLAAFQMLTVVRSIFVVPYRVKLRMMRPVIFNVLLSLTRLGLVAFILTKRPDIFTAIIIYLSTAYAEAILFALASRSYVALDLRPKFQIIKELIPETLPLLFSGYLTILYSRVDVFMISKIRDFVEVSYYSIPTRITEAVGMMAIAIMTSIYPVLSRTYANDRNKFNKVIRVSCQTLCLIYLPILITGSLFAREIITSLFTARYEASSLTFMLLLWFSLFGYLGALYANVLIACKKQHLDTYTSFFQLVTNIGLNLVLIPKYGYNGAAIATVITSIMGLAVTFLFCTFDPKIKAPIPINEIGSAMLLNGIYLALLFALKQWTNLPLLALMLGAMLLYILLLRLFKIFQFKQVKSHISASFKAHNN